MPCWYILTGEYPPQHGGVSDYTRQVARALACAGDEVVIFCPSCPLAPPDDPGVQVRRLPDHFGPRSLAVLESTTAAAGPADRLLVQYVPHAFGCKAMNLPLCLWLARRRRAPLWVMFHEVAYPLESGQAWRHALLARVTRFMASRLVRSAGRMFVTIPAWEATLRSLAPIRRPVDWLPVPSNIPLEPTPGQVAAVRTRLVATGATEVIGHFGTFGDRIAEMLAQALPPLLGGRAQRRALLVGRGGDRFVAMLEARRPELSGQLVASGPLAAEDIAPHLAACDVLVQPFPDGASTRRTSLMAGLALGVPTATTEGRLSEPLWRASRAVALASADDIPGLAAQTEALLGSPQQRRHLAERSRRLYLERFSLGRTVATLRGAQPPF